MKEIIIEKGIPLTKKKKEGSFQYPFEKMQIGESFEVEMRDTFKHIDSFQSYLCSNARLYAKYNNTGMKFATRQTGEKTVRVWRTK